jgi:two-component system response regulator FixJ
MEAAAGGGTVFVVDDDAAVRRSLERLVRSVGLEARSFASAADFLANATPVHPACLIVDVRLPGLSGLDLQERLSSTGWELPTIFISGHGTVPMSVRAMRAGAIDFLQKPFEDEQLLDSVREGLDRDNAATRERGRRAEIEGQIRRLTPREHEVFALIVAGLPNKLIANELGASEKTIKVHRARVMEKLGAGSLAALVHMAHDAGWTTPETRSGSPEAETARLDES